MQAVAVCVVLHPWIAAWNEAATTGPPPAVRHIVESVLNRTPFGDGPLLVLTRDETPTPKPVGRRRLAPPLPTITVGGLRTVALKVLQLPVINFQPPGDRTSEPEATVRGLLLITGDGLRTRETLELLLQQANNFVKWNPRSLFLVFFLTVNTQYHSKVTDMLREFDSRNIINCTIVVILLSGQTLAAVSSVIVYTWFPYSSSGKCRNAEIQLSVLDEWDLERHFFRKNSSLFPEKVPRQLDLCHLKAATYHVPPFVTITNENVTEDPDLAGYEIFTIKLVASMLNVSLNITTVALGSHNLTYPLNTSWTEVVEIGEADIAFGGIHETILSRHNVEITVSYLRDSVTVFVPRASKLPVWMNSFFIIPPLLLITIIGLQFLLSAASFLCSDKNEISYYQKFSHTSVNFCSVVFSVPVRQPVTLRTRTIFASWVLFSQVMSYVNQSTLTSRMMQPNYEEQISTVEEFFSSGLACKTTRNYIRVAPKYCVECSSFESCFNRMVRSGKIGVLGPRIYLTHMSLAKFSRKRGLPYAVPLSDDVFAYNVVMIVPTGSPLLPLLNNAILRVNEADLVSPLLYRYSRDVLRSLEWDFEDEEEVQNTFISLPPFKSTLIALAVVLCFCTMVLLGEVFYNRWIETGFRGKLNTDSFCKYVKDFSEPSLSIEICADETLTFKTLQQIPTSCGTSGKTDRNGLEGNVKNPKTRRVS
ncbi:uncharacterized protein LOC126150560 [Schistocerca cancellata]|uniref:uncharacterized protein LOC126150560 n=1 Tax=Schistocerca cancellata TaxID=274614 RepID=UPI0021189A48|nr:uncharacterized protein LOC126150560 [Schistocerca cancellata]